MKRTAKPFIRPSMPLYDMQRRCGWDRQPPFCATDAPMTPIVTGSWLASRSVSVCALPRKLRELSSSVEFSAVAGSRACIMIAARRRVGLWAHAGSRSLARGRPRLACQHPAVGQWLSDLGKSRGAALGALERDCTEIFSFRHMMMSVFNPTLDDDGGHAGLLAGPLARHK